MWKAGLQDANDLSIASGLFEWMIPRISDVKMSRSEDRGQVGQRRMAWRPSGPAALATPACRSAVARRVLRLEQVRNTLPAGGGSLERTRL